MEYTYSITEDKGCRRIIDAEIPGHKVDEKFDEIYKTLKKQAEIPGFRPGKAPMSIVRSRFRNSAGAEVGEVLVHEAYQGIVKEAGLSPITLPVISKVEVREGEPIRFTASFEVAPEIKLEKTTGFTIRKQSEVITGNDVERAYASILDTAATLEVSDDPAAENDVVIVDMEKTFDMEDRVPQKEFRDFEIELAEDSTLPAFVASLTGTRPGDEKDIYVEYPIDYYDKSLADAKLRFKVTVKVVKKRVPAEPDEAFFAKFGENIRSVEELKEKIRLDLQARRNREVQEDIREQVIKSVISRNQFDLPHSLLEEYLDDVVADYKKEAKDNPVDEEAIRESYRAVGIRLMRWNLLMHEIARQQKISAEKEDIDKWIESFAERYNMGFEQARKVFEESGKVDDVRETVLEAKVLSHILDNSEIVDAA